MTLEQQRDILDHTYDLLTKFNNGVPPKGSVAPWWETSKEGSYLLLEKGIEYGMSPRSLPYAFPSAYEIAHSSFCRSFQHGTRVSNPTLLLTFVPSEH